MKRNIAAMLTAGFIAAALLAAPVARAADVLTLTSSQLQKYR